MSCKQLVLTTDSNYIVHNHLYTNDKFEFCPLELGRKISTQDIKVFFHFKKHGYVMLGLVKNVYSNESNSDDIKHIYLYFIIVITLNKDFYVEHARYLILEIPLKAPLIEYV